MNPEPAQVSGLLFGSLLFELRSAGLKVGLSEWMALMTALEKEAVKNLDDLYYVARALLVKSEGHFDTYDQVFAKVFRGRALPPAVLEVLLEWLERPVPSDISPEALAQLERLPLDQLRSLFEERLKEQKARHDGGNRWVGTGGTSPFGHSGQNPAGVRVGGSGGNRSAIQIATARQFKPYRSDRVIDTRSISVALKKLRRLTRRHQELELDIDETIDETCRNAGDLTLTFKPPRKNEASVLLLMDVGGSMDPYAHLVERLFSAANGLNHWKRFEPWAFHNCVYEKLDPARRDQDEGVMTARLLEDWSPDTFLILVGDAYMAPSELLDVWGAIHYYDHNRTPGIVWLHRLRRHFPRAVWINPMPERAWEGWTVRLIREVFEMFPLTVDGLDRAVDHLLRGTPSALPDIGQMYPELAQYDEIDNLSL